MEDQTFLNYLRRETPFSNSDQNSILQRQEDEYPTLTEDYDETTEKQTDDGFTKSLENISYNQHTEYTTEDNEEETRELPNFTKYLQVSHKSKKKSPEPRPFSKVFEKNLNRPSINNKKLEIQYNEIENNSGSEDNYYIINTNYGSSIKDSSINGFNNTSFAIAISKDDCSVGDADSEDLAVIGELFY